MEPIVELKKVRYEQLIKGNWTSNALDCESKKKLQAFVEQFGIINPIIVAPGTNEEHFVVIKGQEKLDVALKKGNMYINVVCVKSVDLVELTKMLLRLSTVEEKVCAIGQGEMISFLMGKGGMRLDEVAVVMGMSNSAVSKRRSIFEDLDASVRELVENGKVAPRTAEEIAKLPTAEQLGFTKKAVIRGKMSKDKVAELVGLHNDRYASEEFRLRILRSPETVSLGRKEKKKMERLDKPSELKKNISDTVNAISSILSNISMPGGVGFLSNLKAELIYFRDCLEKGLSKMDETIKNL